MLCEASYQEALLAIASTCHRSTMEVGPQRSSSSSGGSGPLEQITGPTIRILQHPTKPMPMIYCIDTSPSNSATAIAPNAVAPSSVAPMPAAFSSGIGQRPDARHSRLFLLAVPLRLSRVLWDADMCHFPSRVELEGAESRAVNHGQYRASGNEHITSLTCRSQNK